MAKRTLKHVLEGFRGSAAPQTARTDHVAIPETLKPEHFQITKVSFIDLKLAGIAFDIGNNSFFLNSN